MAEATYSAKIEDDNWTAFLHDLEKKLGDVTKKTEFMQMISPVVFGDIARHFKDESGPHTGWPLLSLGYLLEQSLKGRDPTKIRMLQDTGFLRGNVLPASVQPSDGIMWVNNAKTDDGFPYAYAHDTGGPILPQREFMWLSPRATSVISKMSLAFVLGRK